MGKTSLLVVIPAAWKCSMGKTSVLVVIPAAWKCLMGKTSVLVIVIILRDPRLWAHSSKTEQNL